MTPLLLLLAGLAAAFALLYLTGYALAGLLPWLYWRLSSPLICPRCGGRIGSPQK